MYYGETTGEDLIYDEMRVEFSTYDCLNID